MSKNKAASVPYVAWRTSSYSVNGGGQCVEAGTVLDGSAQYALRDSVHRDGAALEFPHREWCAFLASVKVDS